LPKSLSNNSWSNAAGVLSLISSIVKTTVVFRSFASAASNPKAPATAASSLKSPLVSRLIEAPTSAP